MPDRDYWGEPYDGAPHPDRSRPEDHDDVPPIVWREWQAAADDPALLMADITDDLIERLYGEGATDDTH